MASTYPSPVVIAYGNNIGSVTAITIAQPNLSRSALYVFNPSASAVLWVSPITVFNSVTNAVNQPFPATVGVGSVPIQPGQGMLFDGWTNGLSAIASAGTITGAAVWEYYQ